MSVREHKSRFTLLKLNPIEMWSKQAFTIYNNYFTRPASSASELFDDKLW